MKTSKLVQAHAGKKWARSTSSQKLETNHRPRKRNLPVSSFQLFELALKLLATKLAFRQLVLESGDLLLAFVSLPELLVQEIELLRLLAKLLLHLPVFDPKLFQNGTETDRNLKI